MSNPFKWDGEDHPDIVSLVLLVLTCFLVMGLLTLLTACDNSARMLDCVDGCSTFSNGVDGIDGADGTDGIDGTDAVFEVVDPCGDNPAFAHEEVLLRLVSGGPLYAHYSNGSLQFLTPLYPNTSYRTTDGTNCHFSIDSLHNIVYP